MHQKRQYLFPLFVIFAVSACPTLCRHDPPSQGYIDGKAAKEEVVLSTGGVYYAGTWSSHEQPQLETLTMAEVHEGKSLAAQAGSLRGLPESTPASSTCSDVRGFSFP